MQRGRSEKKHQKRARSKECTKGQFVIAALF